MNLSTQKNIAPPMRLAKTVDQRPAPKRLTTSHKIGVLNCHLNKYNKNLFMVLNNPPHVAGYYNSSGQKPKDFLVPMRCARIPLLSKSQKRPDRALRHTRYAPEGQDEERRENKTAMLILPHHREKPCFLSGTLHVQMNTARLLSLWLLLQ